jgi:glycosyltransferase involved in cell wall biosynthesis
MHIGIICTNFPPSTFEGGIAHYSKLLVQQLINRGHKIIAICSTEFAGASKKAEINENLKTIRIKGPWNAQSVLKIRKLSVKFNLDCIILQFSPTLFKRSFRLMWATTYFPCQKITAFHTLWSKGIDRLFGIACLIGSQKIIATNSEIMTILKVRLPFLLKKTYWIPIGSNIMPCYCETHYKQNDIPLISYFGMLYPGKGLDLILDVLVKLKQMGLKFNFKFIGGAFLDSEFYVTEFRNKIKKENLNDCVEHLGRIEESEVSKWLKLSRFIFLPYQMGLSDRRGSFVAAISHKKAVLTSPPILPMKFFKNKINVIWPDQPSLSEYVKLSEKMLIDDKLIKRLEEGAKKLSSNYNWEKIAARYESTILN